MRSRAPRCIFKAASRILSARNSNCSLQGLNCLNSGHAAKALLRETLYFDQSALACPITAGLFVISDFIPLSEGLRQRSFWQGNLLGSWGRGPQKWPTGLKGSKYRSSRLSPAVKAPKPCWIAHAQAEHNLNMYL